MGWGLGVVRHDWKRIALVVLAWAAMVAPAFGVGVPIAGSVEVARAAQAPLKIVKTDASKRTVGAALVNDGKSGTAWRVPARLGRDGKRGSAAWIALDLGQQRSVTGVSWLLNQADASSATVQCSADGTRWRGAAKLTGLKVGEWQQKDVDCRARHVRVVFPDAGASGWKVAEVRVFGRQSSQPPQQADCQKIVVPAYFDDDGYWDRMIADGGTAKIVILNFNNGPDWDNPDGPYRYDHWVKQTQRARDAGMTLIGYVKTELGKRPAADVKKDIAAWHKMYKVDGIYFDEFEINPDKIPYYRGVADYTRQVIGAKATVAINPGFTPDRRVMEFVDIVETYEYNYQTYLDQEFPAWTRDYPAKRFLHVVLNVPDEAGAKKVLELAKQRNAGYVFLSDEDIEKETEYKRLTPWLWDLQVKGVCG